MAEIDDFLDVMRAMEPLMASDYVQHQDRICELSQELTRDDLALRYFMDQSLQNDRRRRLSGAQSFFIYSSSAFSVRLNLWFPKDQRVNPENEDMVRQHFSYESCHNHNFDFFTVGLLGPGYKTDFFTTSQKLDMLDIGDRIIADNRWSAVIGKSDALFIPKDTHFHTQYEPDAFSMTMNFIPNRKQTSRQFVLDRDRAYIDAIILPNR